MTFCRISTQSKKSGIDTFPEEYIRFIVRARFFLSSRTMAILMLLITVSRFSATISLQRISCSNTLFRTSFDTFSLLPLTALSPSLHFS